MVASSARPRAQSSPASNTPARAGGAPATPRVDFIALTRNDALLEQIGQSLDGESAIRHAESVDAATELVRASQSCVVLVDAVDQGDLRALIEELQAPDGHSLVVVFAPAEKNESIAGSIKGSATFAVLPVPIETAKTAAVLEGAREEAIARRAIAGAPAKPNPPRTSAPLSAQMHHAEPDAPLVWPTKAPVDASRPGRPHATARRTSEVLPSRRGPPRQVIIGATTGVVLLLVVAGWVVLSRGHRGPATTPLTSAARQSTGDAAAPLSPPPDPATTAAEPVASAPPAPSAIQAGTVDELLDKARVAIRERRYIEPERDNALTYYRSVLAQEPDNGEARQGLARVGAVLDERLKSAMSERRLDEVARTVAQLKLIRPGDPTLKTHENWLADAQVTSALQANDADRAAALLRQSAQNGSLPADRVAQFQADIDRRRAGARAASLEDLVAARIRDGRLVDPANDSAKYYYSQLRKLSDDPRQTASVQRDLQAAYLQKLRTASAQKKAAEVDRWIAEARAIGASTASIAAAQREPGSPAKTAASEAERLTRLVQERVRDGRLLDPPQDSALFQLSALRAVDPAAATAAASGISTALLASGRGALASGKLDDAQRFATAVRQLGVSGGDIDALDADIKTAQAQIAAAPVQVTASQLKRTRFVAPDYPPKALAKQIEGQVKLRYTIGKDGRVKDPVVVESNPAGVFEEAAITAVQRWRYKPYEVDGNIVEATLATVLTFRPDAGSSH